MSSTCNRLDLQTLGSQPIMHVQKSPQSMVTMHEVSVNSKSFQRANKRQLNALIVGLFPPTFNEKNVSM